MVESQAMIARLKVVISPSAHSVEAARRVDEAGL